MIPGEGEEKKTGSLFRLEETAGEWPEKEEEMEEERIGVFRRARRTWRFPGDLKRSSGTVVRAESFIKEMEMSADRTWHSIGLN